MISINLNKRNSEIAPIAHQIAKSQGLADDITKASAIEMILANVVDTNEDEIYFGGKYWMDPAHTPSSVFRFRDITEVLRNMSIKKTGRRYTLSPPIMSKIVDIKQSSTLNIVVGLRDKKSRNQQVPKWIPYDSSIMLDARKRLYSYNEFMSKYYVERKGVRHTTSLMRIFNNKSFEQGGRFYGASYQRLKCKTAPERQELTINGSPTVELDYSALHPTMMYLQLLGTVPEGDPYIRSSFHRARLKLAFNIALNADNQVAAVYALQDRFNEDDIDDGATAYMYLRELPRLFPEFRDQFCTGAGTRLQFLDSEIADKVLSSFVANNKPCLCVHDSFIVKAEDESFLKSVMIDSFQQTLKTDYVPVIK